MPTTAARPRSARPAPAARPAAARGGAAARSEAQDDARDAALVAEALPMLAAALRRKIEAGADRERARAVVDALMSLAIAAGLAEDQTADVYALETLLARTPEPAPRPRATRATKPRETAPAVSPRGPPRIAIYTFSMGMGGVDAVGVVEGTTVYVAKDEVGFHLPPVMPLSSKWKEITPDKLKQWIAAAPGKSRSRLLSARIRQAVADPQAVIDAATGRKAQYDAIHAVPAKPTPAKKAPPTRPRSLVSTTGAPVRVVFSPDGKLSETGVYALVERRDLVASHHPDCSANTGHGLSAAQPRDRSAKELCRQADTIARELDPALMASLAPDAFSGPPTTNALGEVIQGNGRAIALRVAFERYPEKAARYVAYVKERASNFGLEPHYVASFREPVLVRMLAVSDARAVQLGNTLNTFEAEQSPLDRAKAITRSMTPAALVALGAGLDGLMDAAPEGATLRTVLDAPGAVELVGLLPGLDRTGLLAGGSLTPKGKDLLSDLLVAVLFDDGTPGTNARYEAIPHTSRAGLERAMGALVPHAGAAGPRLRRAAEIVRRVQSNPAASRAADVLKQVDPFDTAVFELGDDVLADLWLTAKTQKEVADVLRAYARFLSGYETLFESAPPMTEPAAFRAAVVERRRPNPDGEADGLAVAVLGLVDQLDTSGPSYTDDEGETLLVWVPGLSRLLCVPAERARAAGRAAQGDETRADALAAYGEWLHDEPDGRALALDLPPDALAARLPRTAQVGTGRQIRYRSDKRMESGDRAGRLNGYYHDFQRGRRAVHAIPYPDGGPPVLVVSGIQINGRGILN